jgi:hypothetical protein
VKEQVVGRTRYSSDVAVPVDIAFAYVDNYVFVPDWLVGVSRFEPVGDCCRGMDAVFETTMPFGPWHYTFDTRITEYRRDAVIAMSGRGIGTRTFRFDPLGCGRSVLTMEFDYEPPWFVADKLAKTLVAKAIRRTESRLKRGLEHHHGLNLVSRIA